MGYGDMILIAILLALVVSFWISLPSKARYQDDQRDDGGLDCKQSQNDSRDSNGGDGAD
jgi:hypothetical protein